MFLSATNSPLMLSNFFIYQVPSTFGTRTKTWHDNRFSIYCLPCVSNGDVKCLRLCVEVPNESVRLIVSPLCRCSLERRRETFFIKHVQCSREFFNEFSAFSATCCCLGHETLKHKVDVMQDVVRKTLESDARKVFRWRKLRWTVEFSLFENLLTSIKDHGLTLYFELYLRQSRSMIVPPRLFARFWNESFLVLYFLQAATVTSRRIAKCIVLLERVTT